MDCKVVQNYVITPIVLGQGCFGTVYRGYMKNNKNELLAVKAIPLEKIKNEEVIKREIQILLKLDSPNIVKFYKPAKTKNHLYFFLQYCTTDLKSYVKGKGGKLGQAQVVDIFRQICNGFKEVHQKNIIHRDIKPANFLLHKGVVKIADFGFARVVDTVDQETMLTFLGSPLYMAPQILGKQKFSSKCDVWSLGVTIYEILYGRPPYTAKSPPQLLQNIKNKNLQFPQDIKRSDEIKDLLRKMLVIEEDKRISWNELFVHPVIKPTEQKIEKTDDSLINSFRENQAYMKRTKVVGKVTQLPDEEQQLKSQKMQQNKGTQGDFANDLKMQEQKIKEYARIQEIDEYMRYRRNVSVFLNVQCNNFFSIAGQKLPQLLFYMGLFALLRHQITIHQELQKVLCQDKPLAKFPPDVWPMYLKSSAHGRVLKLVECDLKHLSSYFKEVKARVSKAIKGNKTIVVQVINTFEKNFLETDKFNPEAYTVVMKAILNELEKSGVNEPNFFTKLRVSMDPFKYLDQSIDFGLFYERETSQIAKLRDKFKQL